jgi:hypothetical protein
MLGPTKRKAQDVSACLSAHRLLSTHDIFIASRAAGYRPGRGDDDACTGDSADNCRHEHTSPDEYHDPYANLNSNQYAHSNSTVEHSHSAGSNGGPTNPNPYTDSDSGAPLSNCDPNANISIVAGSCQLLDPICGRL